MLHLCDHSAHTHMHPLECLVYITCHNSHVMPVDICATCAAQL